MGCNSALRARRKQAKKNTKKGKFLKEHTRGIKPSKKK